MQKRAKFGIWMLALLCLHLYFHPLVHKLAFEIASAQTSFALTTHYDPSESAEQCGICNVLQALTPALWLLLLLAPAAVSRRISLPSERRARLAARGVFSGRAPPLSL